MKKYRSKPVEIEAIQLDDDIEVAENIEGITNKQVRLAVEDPLQMVVRILNGQVIVTPGDWIIKGLEGEFYPCKDSVFQKKYEVVK